jgi:hypothetical protein
MGNTKEKESESTLISKETTICKKKRDRKRNKEIFRPLIIESVEDVLNRICDQSCPDEILFRRAEKSSIAPNHVPIKPRARYIGVSQNGTNWQSLIAINNVKVYLGTFRTQKEAAIMFDFHSMVIKYKSARVNFNYTSNELLQMIEIFQKNNNDFDVDLYLKLRK